MARFCSKCNAELNGTDVCGQCGSSQFYERNSFFQKTSLENSTNMKLLYSLGNYSVYEHQQDLSCYDNYVNAYFAKEMNIRRRQLLISLDDSSSRVQSGSMQWSFGDVSSETGLGSGVKAVGNLIKGAVASMVTKESVVKPLYKGTGLVMLEPTYKNIILEDVESWGELGVVLDDSIFLACDSQIKEKVVARTNFSSAFGGKGLFNLCLSGKGVVALECPIPRSELIEFNLKDDTLRIDGNMAIMWSKTLDFTVERSSKSLIGSMVNKEGLVNVYKGSGKVLIAPTIDGTLMNESYNNQSYAVKGPMDGYANSITQ